MRPIDADALLENLDKECGDLDLEYNSEYEQLVNYIENQPTLDYALAKHGEWIHDINNLYACSECLMRQTQRMRGRLMNFCPNCGASMMDGGKSDG